MTYTVLSPMSLAPTLPSRPAPNNNHDNTDTMASAEKQTHEKGGSSAKKKTYPHMSTLPAPLLPTDPSAPRRLIIVGDVHGHLKSLEALLRKAEFSRARGDTVILAGDLVNKGPDSAGVVALAMRIGAFGVRGNHEDRVLSAWEHYEAKRRKAGKEVGIDSDSDGDEGDEEDRHEAESLVEENENGTADTFLHSEDLEEESDVAESSDGEEESANEEDDDANTTNHEKEKKKGKGKGKKKGKGKGKGKGKKKSKDRKPRHSDLGTAKSLRPEHRAWLDSLPLILRIGDLGPRYGEVIVVHAGLVPGIPLESQDPDAVMTMRTLLPSSGHAYASDPNPDSDSGPNSHFDTATPTDTNAQEPIAAAQTQHEEPENPTTESKTNSKNNSNNNNKSNTKNKDKNKHKNKDPHKPMIPSASRTGIPWAEIWTSYQTSVASSPPSPPGGQVIRPATVVYGHDAKAGLRMRRYAFGLDSGCGRDNALTGVVFELASPAGARGRGEEAEDATENATENATEEEEEEWDVGVDINRKERTGRTRIRHRLVSVSCAEV